MAEQSEIEFSWRRYRLRWLGAAALTIGLMAGCHRSPPSSESEPSASGGTDQSAISAKSAGSHSAADDLFPDEKLLAGKHADPSLPPPKFVRRKEVTAQFPDKTPQSIWQVKVFSDNSEVKDGPYKEFYPDGNKFVEGRYVDGQKEGDWTFWGKNGKLLKTEKYRDGKLDGAWTLFREDGSKERDVSFKAGKREGKWVFYDAAGKNSPVEQHEYKASDRDGTWIKWYPNGNKQSEEHYVDGQIDGEQTRWYESGKQKEVQTFKNGVPDGKRIRWKENGEKIDEVEFKNGRPVTPDATPLATPDTTPSSTPDK